MNKENISINSAGPFNKPLAKRGVYADNNILKVDIPASTRAKIIQHGQRIEKQFDLVEDIRKIGQSRVAETLYTLVDTIQALSQFEQRVKAVRVYFFKVFQEQYRSFKGFCCWVSISTTEEVFLIDLIKLRKEALSIVRGIFEDTNALKVGLSVGCQIKWLQRDFNIFPVSVLDLKEILNIWNSPLDLRTLMAEYMSRQDIPIINEISLYRRPNSIQQLDYIALSSSVLLAITSTINTRVQNDQIIVQACVMGNKLCLEPFCFDIQNHQGQAKPPIVITDQDSRILKKLCKWRLHASRMRDQSLEYILPAKVVRSIVTRGVRSMRELTLLYQEHLGREVCRDYDQTVLDIINSKSSKIDLDRAQREVDQCNSHQDFLKLVGWSENSWRRESSDSMRLFKQIVSMQQLQPSIIEDQLNQTKNRVLSNEEMLCIFGYAKHFANNDSRGLADQHSKLLQHHKRRLQNQEMQGYQKVDENPSKFKIPETIKEVYQLANQKKSVKKEKSKSASTIEEKEDPFVIDTVGFLKTIGWD